VIEDVRFTGSVVVDAPDVTLRRIEFRGATVVNDYNNVCKSGLIVEDSDFIPGGPTSDSDMSVLGPGGYTVRNVKIDGVAEGLRVGGNYQGCQPVSIADSFIRVASPDQCTDWHGDGIQGYGGVPVTVRNTTVIMEMDPDCGGTAPFFYPRNQDNRSVDIDGLLVSGGGYPFRNGMPGTIRNLKVVDGSWVFGPVDVNCGAVSVWDAQVVQLSASGQPTNVRPIPCTGDGY
jgi:hypothetical protein